MTSNPDWQAIRVDYENGSSLRTLAAKYNVSKSAIGQRKYKEQWTEREDRRTLSQPQRVISRDANAAVRVADAIKYRQQGWTYERIAAQCSYASPGAARNAIQRELDRVIVQSIEEWRNDHISRLEKLHGEAWEIAMQKTNKGRLFAFDRLLAIAEREAKLLGLDVKADDQLAGVTVIREYGVEIGKV